MNNEVVRLLNIEQIHVNTKQPRKNFDEEKLNELADSIRENGIIQPIIVEELAEDYFQIVA